MKRPEVTHIKNKNSVPPVLEIQGRAKHGKINDIPVADLQDI